MQQAYETGKWAKENFRTRVSPFYRERAMIRGKRIDITPLLDKFWYAGYDGENLDAIQEQSPAAVS